MTYQPPNGRATPVETMTFRQLADRNDGGTQRADFHVIGLVDAGHGAATVDFASFPLEPGSAVWIPPGAVHRWDDIAAVSGTLVLFVPTAPVTDVTRRIVADPDLVGAWRLPEAERMFVDAARAHLVLETAAAGPGCAGEVPSILLSALLGRLRPPHGEAAAANRVFRVFRESVETHFREHHDTLFYARTLGYAPRTLSRAALRATGRTAKGCIVDRIVLEAKRLLAHDRLTAASCAAVLGFPDPSTFSVFFRNATGMRPGAWQTAALDPVG
jgi:AraC-like DNA-binding protein